MQVTIIDVSPEVNKGKYSEIEVAYRKDGKVEGKKFLSFKHPDVYAALKAAKAGDVLQVTTAKEPGRDGKEYWQWTAIGNQVVSIPEAESDRGSTGGTTSAPAASAARSGRVVGSTYETPEERAIKQRLIVAQSSVTTALDIIKTNAGKAGVSEDAVFALADKIFDYVYSHKDVTGKEVVKAIVAMDDDIPE